MGLEEKRRVRAETEANRRLEEMGGKIDIYAKCPALRTDGKTQCDNRAGHMTKHLGAGKCQAHGGNGRFEALVSEIMLAHKAARALNVTPWDALLNAMRRSAGLAAFYDSKVAAVLDDDELRPGGVAYDWVIGSERAHTNTARFATAALNAGIAERLVQAVELEATTLFEFFSKVLELTELPEEWDEKIRIVMRQQALAIENKGAEFIDDDEDVIDSEVV